MTKATKTAPATTQGGATSNPFGQVTPESLKVTQNDWDYLASAIHHIRVDVHGFSFFGSMLQTINIDFSSRVPTACISYKPNKKQFLIEINPAFFRLLTLEERMALLLHEVYHMTDGHLIRMPALEDHKKANFAADAAINQRIPGIPTRDPIRGVFPEDYGLDKDKTLEFYYENWPTDDQSNNQSQGQQGNPSGQRGEPLDVHDWDPNIDESDILDGTEDVVKRTMIKTSTSHNNLPGSVKELLESIEQKRKVINWTKILKSFIKRTTSGVDKEFTRMRPSKRYDYASPGLRLGEVPTLLVLNDTSGSMSIVEINAGLDQVDQTLKAGAKKVSLGLWHTDLYKILKYKKGLRAEVHKEVISGGTDFEPCAQYINRTKPDAVIVFTDGYFSNTATRVDIPILFVISSGGVSQLVTNYPRQKMLKLPSM